MQFSMQMILSHFCVIEAWDEIKTITRPGVDVARLKSQCKWLMTSSECQSGNDSFNPNSVTKLKWAETIKTCSPHCLDSSVLVLLFRNK